MIGGLLLTTLSCKKELIPGTYESQRIAMGNGEIWSWVNFDKDGKTISMGFSLTDGALENLPDSVNHPSGNDHANIFELAFPSRLVTGTPFLNAAVNWNPKGHTAPVYNKPHLDVHFYMIPVDERKLIPHYPDASDKFDNFPPAEYLPADYFVPGPPGGAAEPEMGTHWVDMKAPELQPGGEFKETFVYGSYDGRVIFYEPMITYSHLKNNPFTRSIPWPAKVQISGHYPKQLHVEHSEGVYKVVLEQFEYRKAS